MGFLKIFFKELWAIKPKTVMGIFGGLGIVLIIGLTPVYKNFKGKQLCLALKNDQLNVEKITKLEEVFTKNLKFPRQILISNRIENTIRPHNE